MTENKSLLLTYRICFWLLAVAIWVFILVGCKPKEQGMKISNCTFSGEEDKKAYIRIEESDSLVIEGCTFEVSDPKESNKAPYKAWFGWE